MPATDATVSAAVAVLATGERSPAERRASAHGTPPYNPWMHQRFPVMSTATGTGVNSASTDGSAGSGCPVITLRH